MRLLFFTALLLAAAPDAAAQPAEVQRAFERGNRHHAAGDYEAALRQYEVALAGEWASGALYYNAAGAHYRLGHTGQAVRFYEKARLLLPQNKRLRHNLNVVRSRLDAPPPAPRPWNAALQEQMTALMPPAGYLAAGLALFLLALAWWVRSAAAPGAPFRPRPAPAALLVLGLLLAGAGLTLSADRNDSRAVALRGPLTVHSAPAAGADSTGGLPEGTVVRLLDRRDGWAQVRTSRGDEGWAPADALGEI